MKARLASVSSRRERGRWKRVLAARQQARAEVSRDPVGGELNAGPPRAKAQLPPPPAANFAAHGPGVAVLSLGEAAARGVTRCPGSQQFPCQDHLAELDQPVP
jgi:hypothetical protein